MDYRTLDPSTGELIRSFTPHTDEDVARESMLELTNAKTVWIA